MGLPYYPVSLPELWLSKHRNLTDMDRETHILVLAFSKEEKQPLDGKLSLIPMFYVFKLRLVTFSFIIMTELKLRVR